MFYSKENYIISFYIRRKIRKMKRFINKRGVLLTLFVFFMCLFTIAKFETNIHKNKYKCDRNKIDVVFIWTNETEKDTNVINDNVQLKYFLRSLELYIPWVHNIFIVTYEKIPRWLNLDNKKIKLIPYNEILHKNESNTTMNILSKLYKMKDLSQCFIYFKPDLFLVKPIEFEDFYGSIEGFKIYLGELFGKCSPKCYWSQINDNICDLHCFNKNCKYDGQDCKNKKFVNKHYEDKKIINNSSIQYTNNILDNFYGKDIRRMYQNVPILFQKNILKNINNKFNYKSSEIDLIFLYYHYIINEKLEGNISTIFNYFDRNKDRYWSNDEMFEVFIKLFNYKLEEMKKFDSYYIQCREYFKISTETNKNFQILNEYYVSIFSQIDRDTVLCCQSLIDLLTKYFHQLNKYQYKIINEKNVLDLKIDSNINDIVEIINNDERKFLYINMKSMKNDLYNILFPKRSKYEHIQGESNPFKSIAEFQIWEHINKIHYTLITIGSAVILIIIFSCVRMYRVYKNNRIKDIKA